MRGQQRGGDGRRGCGADGAEHTTAGAVQSERQ